MLAGVLVWSYPSAASWFSARRQVAVIENAGGARLRGDAAANAAQIRLAHAYNNALASGAELEAGHRVPSSAGHYRGSAVTYADALSDGRTGVMARLQIPKIGLDLPVYHGTADATLLKGLGHLEGTSLPVGGPGTHAVITGHRGLAQATMFTHLDKVGVGDRFTITTFGQVLTYKVIRTKVVDPDQTESLRPVAGQDLVTLVTCTPLGINSERMLVTGERVPTSATEAAAARSSPIGPGFPWWAVWCGAAVLACAGYVAWSGRTAVVRRPPRRGR